MITRPQERPHRHPITAYDFEWRQVEEEPSARFPLGRKQLFITLCGAFDERGYRSYATIEAFLAGELIEANCGRRFYAHYGGASDMVFLLRAMVDVRSLSIRGLFSGSSAIVVQVEDGQKRWTFLDSFWTMRTSLAKIGKSVGLEKGKVDHDKEISEAELREYNEQDCRILYEALVAFQRVVNDEGGELRVTAASTSLDLFLRRYLTRPIKNSPHLSEIARPAYIASRVEPFWNKCERAELWDINSSFPYSFTGAIPGDLTRSSAGRLPSSGLWLADVEVSVRDEYPALPYRHNGRVFFPNGTFRTRITSEDFACGRFDVLSVGDVWEFDGRDCMRGFAETYYAKRAKGGFESEVYKIFLNSLYGKFAERDEKTVLHVRPKKREPHWDSLGAHIYLDRHAVSPAEHAHVPISAFITARSRRYLLEWIRLAANLGRVYYCDTDSVLCDALPAAIRSEGLGGLKLEAKVVSGVFQGPKLYAYEREAEEIDKRMTIKAKGFSRVVSSGKTERRALTYEDFLSLQSGESATIERMRRIRELLAEQHRRGEGYIPDAVRQLKRLRAPTPKRAQLPDGGSRPWNVDELDAL